MTPDSNPKTGSAPGTRQPVEEYFKHALANLSRRLGERTAIARADARRAAMRAYDLARAPRLKWWLAAGVSVIATMCVAWFIVLDGAPEIAPSPDVMSSAAPASPAPTVVGPTMTSQLERALPQPGVESLPVQLTPAALRRDEVVEVQKRLSSFGFSPGPFDGVAGPKTERAVWRYQQNRGQQVAAVDRPLLDQLRQDSAPQVPPPKAAQRARSGNRAAGARSADPFEPLRVAGHRFTQWVQSLTR